MVRRDATPVRSVTCARAPTPTDATHPHGRSLVLDKSCAFPTRLARDPPRATATTPRRPASWSTSCSTLSGSSVTDGRLCLGRSEVGDTAVVPRAMPILAGLTAAIAVLLAFGTGGAFAAASCAFDPTQSPVAHPDDEFNSLFRAYGDSNSSLDDWTGGDTTNSVPLPDGRDVWIFSDTFLGAVNPDGTRSDPTFVHNSLVVQSAAGVLGATLHAGRYPHAKSLIQAPGEVEGD